MIEKNRRGIRWGKLGTNTFNFSLNNWRLADANYGVLFHCYYLLVIIKFSITNLEVELWVIEVFQLQETGDVYEFLYVYKLHTGRNLNMLGICIEFLAMALFRTHHMLLLDGKLHHNHWHFGQLLYEFPLRTFQNPSTFFRSKGEHRYYYFGCILLHNYIISVSWPKNKKKLIKVPRKKTSIFWLQFHFIC